MKRLILTGDDFGLAVPVNEAIEVAHRDGVLGSASLMVGAAEAADAVERARRLPSLRVGLHLVLVEGRPLLPAASLPALVDEAGEFRRDLVEAGLRFFFQPTSEGPICRNAATNARTFQFGSFASLNRFYDETIDNGRLKTGGDVRFQRFLQL